MKKLLFSVTKKDLRITSFTAGGPGGQHQNKVASAVRIVHKDSGAVGEARDTRSYHQNLKLAFKRMAESEKFTAWRRIKTAELIDKKTIDEKVDEQLDSRFLKIECRDEGNKWVIYGKENVDE